MTSETALQRHDNMLFLNRVVFDALNRRIIKDIFDKDFAAWFDGGESYRIMFRISSLSRDEIARLKSAGVTVEAVDAYDNTHVQVFARVADINRVHGHINDGRKHVIPAK